MSRRFFDQQASFCSLQTGRSSYYQGEAVFAFLHSWIPTLASRVIAEPITLQMVRVRAPRDLASLSAQRVSSVSPDWEMAMASWPGSTMGSR